jgi:hypothetical protein
MPCCKANYKKAKNGKGIGTDVFEYIRKYITQNNDIKVVD